MSKNFNQDEKTNSQNDR
jgi:hypothetical protein